MFDDTPKTGGNGENKNKSEIENIITDLNKKRGKPPVYKNDFTIDNDGVPVCPFGYERQPKTI